MNDRDYDARPYTPDENRVADYLRSIMSDIGAGDDPIGFLIASHNALRMRPKGSGRTFGSHWSNAEQRYVGQCDQYPTLSYLSQSESDALLGIMTLVAQAENKAKALFFSIESAPANQRLVVFGKMPTGHSEMAMAWKDKIDGRWYHAPQGGLVRFVPTRWCYAPALGEHFEEEGLSRE